MRNSDVTKYNKCSHDTQSKSNHMDAAEPKCRRTRKRTRNQKNPVTTPQKSPPLKWRGYGEFFEKKVRTHLTPFVRREFFSVAMYYSYVAVSPPPVTHNWHDKSADHGGRRLLPLAPPMVRWRTNKAYRHHPYIMGYHWYAWFSCLTYWRRVLR